MAVNTSEPIGTESSPIAPPSSCTVDTCPINTSYYMYRIDLVPNVVFLSLYALYVPFFLIVWFITRRGHFFTLAFILGLGSEIIGYTGRVLSYKSQWDMVPFLIQIICLTMGPALLSAGIYVCIGRIVTVYGEQNSRIAAASYAKIVRPYTS